MEKEKEALPRQLWGGVVGGTGELGREVATVALLCVCLGIVSGGSSQILKTMGNWGLCFIQGD